MTRLRKTTLKDGFSAGSRGAGAAWVGFSSEREPVSRWAFLRIFYTIVLQHIPSVAEAIQKSQREMARVQNLRVWSAIMAVGFAPFAEEYLFRGLLFRALDREWGGWRAVAGGAAFFAIYHPPLAWLPVGLLGAVNCLVFKKSGRLAPAVILHMIYNATVVGTG